MGWRESITGVVHPEYGLSMEEEGKERKEGRRGKGEGRAGKREDVRETQTLFCLP